MKHVVKILPLAEADIERNAKWWSEHHSVDQAVKWFSSVRAQILSLEDFPESHSLSFENDEFPFEIREKIVWYRVAAKLPGGFHNPRRYRFCSHSSRG